MMSRTVDPSPVTKRNPRVAPTSTSSGTTAFTSRCGLSSFGASSSSAAEARSPLRAGCPPIARRSALRIEPMSRPLRATANTSISARIG